jgi:hypothetical protein
VSQANSQIGTTIESDPVIAYDEATLLSDCFLGCLCRDAIWKGEYQQCIGLISEYEYGWWESYIVNFRDFELRDTAKREAERRLLSPQSPLASRQDFRNFLARWRRLRATVMPLVVGEPADIQSNMQVRENTLSPYLRQRRQYDQWCQELENSKNALSAGKQSRAILEQGITQMKVSIDEVELLSNLARGATEKHRDLLLQLRLEMKRSKERDLLLLESEMSNLQEAIGKKETEIEILCQSMRVFVQNAKHGLGDLVGMVEFVRQLPEV